MIAKLKHAGGRPTLYRREMCDRLIEALAEGLTAEAAAARIGISSRSLFYWQQQHPDFFCRPFRRAEKGLSFGGRSALSPWLTARPATLRLWCSDYETAVAPPQDGTTTR
jgi:hypothetical protein